MLNILLIAGGLLIGEFLPILVLPISAGSAVWVYNDAMKLHIDKYKTTNLTPSTTPGRIAFLVLLFPIIILPLYMVFRERIKEGRIALKAVPKPGA